MENQPKTPELEFVFELRVMLKPPIVVGQTPKGLRRVIPISGGTVRGPQFNATILEGGADWQFIRDDGVVVLEAHYQFQTDDGVIIYIKNQGIRVASPEITEKMANGEAVADSEYYFATVPTFEAPQGKYYWLNNAIFVCKARRNPNDVSVFVWKVL